LIFFLQNVIKIQFKHLKQFDQRQMFVSGQDLMNHSQFKLLYILLNYTI